MLHQASEKSEKVEEAVEEMKQEKEVERKRIVRKEGYYREGKTASEVVISGMREK